MMSGLVLIVNDWGHMQGNHCIRISKMRRWRQLLSLKYCIFIISVIRIIIIIILWTIFLEKHLAWFSDFSMLILWVLSIESDILFPLNMTFISTLIWCSKRNFFFLENHHPVSNKFSRVMRKCLRILLAVQMLIIYFAVNCSSKKLLFILSSSFYVLGTRSGRCKRDTFFSCKRLKLEGLRAKIV